MSDSYCKGCKEAIAEVEALRTALAEAIDRLNAFVLVFEGEPEPSENDSKALIVRLVLVLDGVRPKVPAEHAEWKVGDRVQLRGPLVDAYEAGRRRGRGEACDTMPAVCAKCGAEVPQ